jgi:hypothetical protein
MQDSLEGQGYIHAVFKSGIDAAIKICNYLSHEVPEVPSQRIPEVAIQVLRITGYLSDQVAENASWVIQQPIQWDFSHLDGVMRHVLMAALEMYDLPNAARQYARVFAGELVFSRSNVQTVVELLGAAEKLMVGIEVWKPIDGHPDTTGLLSFPPRQEYSWKEYVQLCTNIALEFVKQWPDADYLFQLTWYTQQDWDNFDMNIK